MKERAASLTKWFILSTAIVLFITGSAKIYSGFGNAKLLRVPDPIIGLKFSQLMFLAGAIEIILASICVVNKWRILASIFLAAFGTALLTYRLGLWWLGWRHPCACLGGLTDALNVSSQVADNVMKIVLAYLLIGSYGILFHQWWKNRKQVESPSPGYGASGS